MVAIPVTGSGDNAHLRVRKSLLFKQGEPW